MLARDWMVVCLLQIGGMCACKGLEGCVFAKDWRIVLARVYKS